MFTETDKPLHYSSAAVLVLLLFHVHLPLLPLRLAVPGEA